MSASAAQKRLTTDAIPALTLRLALPGLLSMLACGLCTLLDAVFLARCGEGAAAAAALCFPLVTLIQTIGFTLGMGAGSLLSREIGGGGDMQRARTAAAAALYGAVLLACLLCLPGIFFPRALLRFLGAQMDGIAPAVSYARWVLACGVFSCAGMVLSSLLRGQGHTVPAVFAYGAGALLGAGLGFLLVVRLRWGVAGVGAAMLARELLILAVFIVYTLRTPGAVRPLLRDLRGFRLRDLALIMRSGTPTLVRQGLSSISAVMLSRLCAQLGTPFVAGTGAAQRVVNLVSSAIIGFGQGFSPVCGANYGAGRMDRVRQAYRLCMRLLVIALSLLGAALFALAGALLGRLCTDAQAATFGAAFLRGQCVVFFAQGAVILMNMLTQSMGLPVRASLVAASRQGYVLIALLMVLPRWLGAWGLILAQPVSDMLSLGIGLLLTRQLLKDEKSGRAIASAQVVEKVASSRK